MSDYKCSRDRTVVFGGYKTGESRRRGKREGKLGIRGRCEYRTQGGSVIQNGKQKGGRTLREGGPITEGKSRTY